MQRLRLIVLMSSAIGLAGPLAAQAAAQTHAANRDRPAAAVAPRRSAPVVALTTPANHGLVEGQPVYSGSADPTAQPAVTVTVYLGSSAGGVPVQVVNAPVQNGQFSASGLSTLADGTYTAQASQANDATPPEVGMSAAVTFQIDNGSPELNLDRPKSEPFTTATPTLSGQAATAEGGTGPVSLTLYPGSSTDAAPVASGTGDPASSGDFTIRASPAVADGVYTAIASQTTPSGSAFSQTIQIEVNAVAPALTVTAPVKGAGLVAGDVSFGGAAGQAYGDSRDVHLTLYHGSSATGHAAGTLTVTQKAGAWSARWPTKLKAGTYTLQAEQTDLAGHDSRVTVSFRVIPAVTVIGAAVQISPRGTVSVPIGCPARQACTGDVLILTPQPYQTQTGGPSGRLRVMFASFVIPAGEQGTVSRPIPAAVLSVLRRRGEQRLDVVVALGSAGSSRRVMSAVRPVRGL